MHSKPAKGGGENGPRKLTNPINPAGGRAREEDAQGEENEIIKISQSASIIATHIKILNVPFKRWVIGWDFKIQFFSVYI